jgi:hypothetical protein
MEGLAIQPHALPARLELIERKGFAAFGRAHVFRKRRPTFQGLARTQPSISRFGRRRLFCARSVFEVEGSASSIGSSLLCAS